MRADHVKFQAQTPQVRAGVRISLGTLAFFSAPDLRSILFCVALPGWAAGLPTWRIADAPVLRALFGGREITGYHVFVFSFMAAVFHLPFFLALRWSWRLEARVLGSLCLFWIAEDILWFVLNPAYGLARLTPTHAPWHPHWLLGVPVDYLVFPLVAVGLLGWSYAAPVPPDRQEKP